MDEDTLMMETEESMDKASEHALHEFSTIRSGKASPSLVDGLDVHVTAYGSKMKLRELASINTPEPRLIVIQPFDGGTVHDIEKAIKDSKLGLQAVQDGKVIRIPLPELSEERRKDLVKVVKQMAEEGRISIRGARKQGMDGIKKLKADNVITEDDVNRLEKEVQRLTDEHIKKLDEASELKEKELMTV